MPLSSHNNIWLMLSLIGTNPFENRPKLNKILFKVCNFVNVFTVTFFSVYNKFHARSIAHLTTSEIW